MNFNLTKILGFTLATGALVYLAEKSSGLSRLSAEMKTLQRVALEGNKVKIYVTFRNPTQGSITVKHPTVDISYKETTLVSSPPINKDYTIQPFADTVLDPIILQLNPSAITTLPAMLMEAASGKVTMISTVTTTVNNTFPKIDKQEFSWSIPLLNKNKKGKTDLKTNVASTAKLLLKQ